MQALWARRPDRGPSGLKPPPPCGAGVSSSRGDLRPRQAGASPRWTRARRRPGRQQDELDVAGRAALPPDAPPPRDSGVLPGPVTWPVSHGDAGWDKSPRRRARASLPRPAPAGPFSGDGECGRPPTRGCRGHRAARAGGPDQQPSPGRGWATRVPQRPQDACARSSAGSRLPGSPRTPRSVPGDAASTPTSHPSLRLTSQGQKGAVPVSLGPHRCPLLRGRRARHARAAPTAASTLGGA